MSRFYGDFDPASTASTTVTATVVDSTSISLYMPFENDMNDHSIHSHTVSTAGTPELTSAQAKFGSNSVRLDSSTGEYFTIPHNSVFDLNGTDFTIEMFVYFLGSEGQQAAVSKWTGSGNNKSFILMTQTGAGAYFYWTENGSTNQNIQANDLIPTEQWTHIAVTQTGTGAGSGRMYINGSPQTDTDDFSGIYNTSSDVIVGSRDGGGTSLFNGFIEDLRIIKGVSLYTTAFTVPTTAVGNSINIVSSTSDTRSHSHVWNYTDVYDARFANTWPKNDPFASLVTTTGATAVEPGNGFRYLIFTTSGSLTVPSDAAGVSVEYLVVGGGGGGTANRGAGAGAGGLRTNVPGNPLAGSSMTLPAATYPVVVGAGGTSTTGAFPFSAGTRTAGTASSFNNIESAGGGRGAAGSGGSGAGGHTTPDPSASQNAGSGNVPPVTPPQGQNGGIGGSSSSGRGGGGGGAGGEGAPGGPSGGVAPGTGAGGAGHPIPAFASPLIAPGIPSDAATAIGPTGLFAGGGGGGGSSNGSIPGGAAGPGGGGAGGRASINPGSSNPSSGEDGPAGAPGVDNTGGGGGGAGNYAGNNPAMRPGGVGGKGVVILRFPTTEK